jgi:DNA-binding protein H-NS
MIAYLRSRMDEFHITPDDLAAALLADQESAENARYQHPGGDTWDGKGAMPSWLKQAVSAGQTLDHFEIKKSPPDQQPLISTIDWSNDPFAGSRLARR